MLYTGLLLACLAAPPTQPAAAALGPRAFQNLRSTHPRLIGLPERGDELKKLIETDTGAAACYAAVKRRADELLDTPPLEYKIIGPRLLNVSRGCLERVYTLATVHRIDGGATYAERAVKEMLNAAAFRDWNPSHFLDTAEMTHALAIGYDWLHAAMPAESRQAIAAAIITKGLREGEKVYRGGRGWARGTNNWNQVCNGGMTIGALAVAEVEPPLADFILRQAIASVPLAMRHYAPDGGWNEGPGYWNYATSYNAYMLAGLETALGTDFGLGDIPGFARAGDFRMHSTGPLKRTFNFADSGDKAGSAACMMYLARKFNNPTYAWHEREVSAARTAQHLWWYDPRGEAPSDFPLDHWSRAVDVVFFRSSWTDPNALFVGFKGGDNRVSHSHLELGTFVLDADGQRWAVEVGGDDYNLPGYFGDKRWTYQWLATAGQNTLDIGGQNQHFRAVAPVRSFASTPARAAAVVDLSAAYAGRAMGALRGVAMLDRKQVLVQDEIALAAGPVNWHIYSPAKIELKGAQAELTQAGETLRAEILSPAGAVFLDQDGNPPPPQRQVPGLRRLAVALPPGRNIRIAVAFTPGSQSAGRPEVQPLANWGKPSNR